MEKLFDSLTQAKQSACLGSQHKKPVARQAFYVVTLQGIEP